MSDLLPRSVRIDNYDYMLPRHRIARFPLEDPAASKLLIYNKGKISHSYFQKLPEYLTKGDLIIFNNTRVIQARIIMQKPTGSKIEIFLLEPVYPPEYNLSFSSVTYCHWRCMTGNKKKWKTGQLEKEVFIGNKKVKLLAELINDRGLWQEIKFSWEPGEFMFGPIIESAGLTPIPPYLDRAPEPSDKDRYQTVYSRFEGSVAAPTAGLHFTRELLTGLKKKGVPAVEVTLHVGAGTFLPVKTQTIDEHQMHTEHFSVDAETLEKIKNNHGNITAVGTTTVRTLETLYWLGVKQLYRRENSISRYELSQWEAGGLPGDVTAGQALEALLKQLAGENKQNLVAKTRLMIIPGYSFKLVNRLITNFHQPRSTLLLLIAAFIGEDWRMVYRYALENDFRFLSYGDSSLLMPGTDT